MANCVLAVAGRCIQYCIDNCIDQSYRHFLGRYGNMPTTTPQRTVRVSEATHRMLQELASHASEPMTVVLARAVDRYRREQLLRAANDAWAAIKADPSAWREMKHEDAVWDATLIDGLEDEPW